MGNFGFIFGFLAFFMAAAALHRIRNLEKKLKQFDVIPRDFDSRKDEKDAELE